MPLATVRSLEAALKGEPKEELELWRHSGPPNEPGSWQRSRAEVECSIRRRCRVGAVGDIQRIVSTQWRSVRYNEGGGVVATTVDYCV
jgi:hypothetical protein